MSSLVGTNAKGHCCGDCVWSPLASLPYADPRDIPFPAHPLLVSSSGLKATPSSLGKMLRSDILVLPDAALQLPSTASAMLGLAADWDVQIIAHAWRRSPSLKRSVSYSQGFGCAVKVIFKNDLLPLNQSLYPYALFAFKAQLEPFADLFRLLADPK